MIKRIAVLIGIATLASIAFSLGWGLFDSDGGQAAAAPAGAEDGFITIEEHEAVIALAFECLAQHGIEPAPSPREGLRPTGFGAIVRGMEREEAAAIIEGCRESSGLVAVENMVADQIEAAPAAERAAATAMYEACVEENATHGRDRSLVEANCDQDVRAATGLVP